MRLGYVIIYVKDVGETVEFYERAFGLKVRFVHESGGYAELETGQTALAFVVEGMISHPFLPNRKAVEPAGIEICLVTEDVQGQFDRAVKVGAEAVSKPEQKPWGQLVCYVRDNNGCLVEICSPID
ncbi:MAG: VOC family protein [Verrucomicrobia bacterium]|nr:VOC family protein [Verrucomicrobiota bacterium]